MMLNMKDETRRSDFYKLINEIEFLFEQWKAGEDYEDYFMDVNHSITELSLFYFNMTSGKYFTKKKPEQKLGLNRGENKSKQGYIRMKKEIIQYPLNDKDYTLEVVYEFTKGQPEIIKADPNDCQQGFSDEYSIREVYVLEKVQGIIIPYLANFLIKNEKEYIIEQLVANND